MKRKLFTAGALALAIGAVSGAAVAAEMGHGSMQGMHHGSASEGHGKTDGRIFAGKVGPWTGEARLIDMKAQMEKMKGTGMRMEGKMKSHHFELFLADPKTKAAVTEGKGTVTVVGPDKKEAKSDIAAMAGHFGVDVDLPAPGRYTFQVVIASGKTKGSATFSHTMK